MEIKVRPLIQFKNERSKIDWTDTANWFAWVIIVFVVGYIFIYHGLIR